MSSDNSTVRTISREVGATSSGALLTPQRLHAELLTAGKEELEAYLQGALKDGTARKRTHRFGQADRRWLRIIEICLRQLGHAAWIYREGKDRRFWFLETSARFLDISFDCRPLAGRVSGLHYARGYFDAEGGMPRSCESRLYFQFCQKDRPGLVALRSVLESWEIECGRIHNPSRRVDPDYWRFYVRAAWYGRFMETVGSWHPRKRQQMQTRMKI